MIFVEHIRNMWSIPELRRKILCTLGFLVIYRLGSHIPMPGLNPDAVDEFTKQLGGAAGGALALMAAISGSSIGQAAIFSLGIMPYISASIIFSLLAKVVPQLEEISKEGASGQKKINEWTRYSTVPLCLLQGFFIVRYLAGYQTAGGLALVVEPGLGFIFTGVLALTAGALFLMWIGELITEYGIGNGISLLIMAGIVAQAPTIVQLLMGIGPGSTGEGANKLPILIALSLLFFVVVMGVVLMSQAQRRIPVQAAKHTRGRRVYGGQKSHLPLRLNMAGVMPVIFASSLLMFPVMVGSMIFGQNNPLSEIFRPGNFWYTIVYLGMIYFFAYFWTSLMFQPTEMSNNMKEHGQFVPGIRPGRKTAEFLNHIMVRITFVGAGFLALVALFPQLVILVIENVFLRGQGAGSAEWMAAQFLGGTGILIVVGVVLDMAQKVESHLLMRHYSGFMKKGRVKGRLN